MRSFFATAGARVARIAFAVAVAVGLLWVGSVLLVGGQPSSQGADAGHTIPRAPRVSDAEIRRNLRAMLAQQDAINGTRFWEAMETAFPQEYETFAALTISSFRAGRSETEVFVSAARFGQSFVQRHWSDAMHARPEEMARLVEAHQRLLLQAQRGSPEACAQQFEGGGDLRYARQLTQAAPIALATYNEALMSAIISGHATPYEYSRSMDSEYTAFLRRAQAIAADDDALAALGTAGYSAISAARRCNIGVSVLTALIHGSTEERSNNYARLMTPRM